MAILVINEPTREEIRKAIERARERPLPINEAPDTWVMLGQYRTTISFEVSLAGTTVRHLSISAPEAGTLPSASAVRMIIEAFGFKKRVVTRTWLEEIDPQHRAYNIAQTED